MTSDTDRRTAEERFREVFAHLGAVTAYARRRGSRDADEIAAEAMSIAWRRFADVPRDDPQLDRALRTLTHTDRELLLLVAWEDLSPAQAARALGVQPAAVRVRLLRARRRLRAALDEERRP